MLVVFTQSSRQHALFGLILPEQLLNLAVIDIKACILVISFSFHWLVPKGRYFAKYDEE